METGQRLKVSSDRLVKPGIEPATPGLQGKRLIHYTTAAPPREVMIAILLGSFFFSTSFYQYYSRHDAQVKKKTLKTKVANTKCRLFAPILMHPAGLSWFKIMRPL